MVLYVLVKCDIINLIKHKIQFIPLRDHFEGFSNQWRVIALRFIKPSQRVIIIAKLRFISFDKYIELQVG